MKDKSIPISRERRKSPRWRFDARSELALHDSLRNGRVRDIGREGMFIKMISALPIGAAFTAQLVLKEPVLIKCIVRRVEPEVGMGVSFVAPGTEGRKRLAAFLDTLVRE